MIKMETTDNTVNIGAKLEKSVAQTLRAFSQARGESLSTVVRRSIRKELASHSYLTDDEKEALGVVQDGQE